jgi:hypothetical protein
MMCALLITKQTRKDILKLLIDILLPWNLEVLKSQIVGSDAAIPDQDIPTAVSQILLR